MADKPFASLGKPITALTPIEQRIVEVAVAELDQNPVQLGGDGYAVLADGEWLRRIRLSAAAFDTALKHLKARGGIKLRRPSKRTAPGTTAIAILPRLALGLQLSAPKRKSKST